MKTRMLNHGCLGLFLVLALTSGCTRQNPPAASVFINSASAQPVVLQSNAPAVAPAVASNPPAPAEIAATVTNAEPSFPTHLRLSVPLGEAIKLVQAGVDESVLLAFVTNSAASFRLGAEEIVYLNDLGVSAQVITAMMHRDQSLKQFWADQAAVAAVSNQVAPAPEAAAPSYVNPPSVAETTTSAYVSDDYFDETLSPYGTWVQIEGYGRCWRPTVVVTTPGWRPYGDRGRWVYTDSGWYWLSDYSWGAVAFHYGRWFEHPRHGWCWWPDRVWGPSWVSWRYSDDYCGWAPLPPSAFFTPGLGFTYHGGSVVVGFEFGLGWGSYTYVPWGYACGLRPYQHRVPRHQSETIHGHTRPVNDYATGPNRGAINRGIPPERVKSYTRTEVRTVNIHEQAGRGTRVERLERDGRTLVVNRPKFEERGTTKPAMLGRGEPGEAKGERNRATPTRMDGSVGTPTARPPTPPQVGRSELKVDRSRTPETPPRANVAAPTPKPNPAPAAAPVSVSPARVENRPIREREPVAEVPVTRSAPAVVVAPKPVADPVATAPVPRTAPTPVQRPTPIMSQPIVIQSAPQPAPQPANRPTAPSSPVVVIGRGGNTTPRSGGGRDYSVWSTPTPAAPASEPASAPRYQAAPVAPQSPTVVVPRTTVTTESQSSPTPAWTPPSTRSETRDRMMGSERSRNVATPATAPVSRPAPQMSVPEPARVARPAPSVPSPSPAPRAPAVESRPAPAAPAAPARTESRSESRSESRPTPGSGSGSSRPNR
jgi:hypothetical protein